MQRRIDSYFKTEKVWTVPGLAYYLGFADRKSLFDYENKEEFWYAIKRGKLRIEDYTVKKLFETRGPSAGFIFILKNMGYKDQADIDLNIDLKAMPESLIDAIAYQYYNENKRRNEKIE